MDTLYISSLEPFDTTTEVVERKGLGHPDTICDALAETLSRNLCREYRRRFGTILHHNVDKALLLTSPSTPPAMSTHARLIKERAVLRS
ncbi:MAG: methionine adenosyltransferase [Pseudolabrys sp.]